MEEHRPVEQDELKSAPLSKEDAYFRDLEEERKRIQEQKKKARHCPADGTVLVEETRRGLILDRCPQCGGAWLDACEFDVLRKAFEIQQKMHEDRPDDVWHRFLRNLLPYQK